MKKIQASNLLTNSEAGTLVQALLRAWSTSACGAKRRQLNYRGRAPVLEQSAYVELLSSVVDAALKATPAQNQRGPANPRRGTAGGPVDRNVGPQPPTEAQIEQNNARRWLAGLQGIMPMIDQYLPAKAPLVRQKMTEMGMSNNSHEFCASVQPAPGKSESDRRCSGPGCGSRRRSRCKSRLYQQAAYKALEEGDTERARQIANDHLQNNAREAVMQRVDFREMAKKAEGARIEDIRQAVARLQTDNEKIDLLIQVAGDAQKNNPKLAASVAGRSEAND